MKPIARAGDLHKCPKKGHGVTPIISGSGSVAGGQSIARVGDKTGCGATIIQGSANSVVDSISGLQDRSWWRNYYSFWRSKHFSETPIRIG